MLLCNAVPTVNGIAEPAGLLAALAHMGQTIY